MDIGDLLVDKNMTMLDVEETEVAKKCCMDAQATLAIYNHYISMVDMDYYNVELALIPILLEMSRKGLLIDHEVREELEIRLSKNVEYYRTLADAEGFNIGSAMQVGYTLAKRGTMLPFTKRKRQLRTDEHILKQVRDPLAGLTLAFREDNKLLTTYVQPWTECERAYCRWHMDAVTGRISSTDRNMQNIPKGRPRNMFLPDNRLFTDIDFNQLEAPVG